jgi:putative nucleotidyltransferase with HDIG domain
LPGLLNHIQKSFHARSVYKAGLLLIGGLLSFAAIALPLALRPASFALAAGTVSTQDITAPYDYTYTSLVLTQKARDAAAANVGVVYLPSDPSITRTQIDNLHIALNYISSVRADTYATPAQKAIDLSAIKNIQLTNAISNSILGLSDERWQSVQQEALNVLEQTMRKTIRDYQVQDMRSSIPTLISFSFPEDQSKIIVALVSPLITANSLFSEEQTALARQAAMEQVAPVTKTYAYGQSIINRGQIITPEQYEALQIFGLITPADKSQDFLATGALVLTMAVFVLLYFRYRAMAFTYSLRHLTVILITFLVFLYGARLLIPNRAILPYFYPLPAFVLIIGTLVNFETSMVLTLVLSILAAYNIPYSLTVVVFYSISSLAGLLALGRGKRVVQFLLAGLAVAVAGSLVIVAYRLTDTGTDTLGLLTLIAVTFLNGILSASAALLIQFLLSQLLGLTSALNLIELARPDNPLLQYILQNAPGTYQHSLQVANMTEQAAEAIGADALLSRAGALYHDAGKALNAQFFVENQVPGKVDAHDNMDPVITATTIIAHVTDGVALATKYRMPPRIKDFIREHHGTMITRYPYTKAVENANGVQEKVDIEKFRYPGPTPRSKETALLMMADRSEATARAELPKDEESLRKIIKNVIDDCLAEGQLDQTNLTFRDLSRIEASFLKTLQNSYHPRIKYPELKTVESVSEPQQVEEQKSD